MKKKAVLMVLLVLAGCGGGGGSDGGWTGPVTPSQYPDVQGKYTFVTAKGSYVCTDRSKGTVDPISNRVSIRQNGAALTFYEISTAGDELQDTQMTGTLTTSGAFTSSRETTGYIIGVPGTNTITYALSGLFTETGWSGDYTMVIYNNYIRGGCTSNATFTGTQFSSEDVK
jgi:hypothetical protein